MPLTQLHFDATSGIATLTINRPEVLNAIDVPTAQAINTSVQAISQQRGLRCVVLQGAGRAFVAGGDLSRFAEDFDAAASVVDALLDALHPAIETLAALDAPVLASVHGAVAGAGLSLMAGCDLAIAAENTRFVVAYDRIGAAPDCGGTYYLPRKLGAMRAAEFVLLGETWNAATAMAHGLINRVVATEALASETAALAKRLALGPTLAYGHYKRLAAQAFSQPLPEQLEHERNAFKAATASQDFREGVSAFLQKRPAHFSGQ